MEEDLETAKTEGLAQLADRRYRERVPRHGTEVHEFAFVFCGKFCVAAARTLERNVKEDWKQSAADSTIVSGCMVDVTNMDKEDFTDEDAYMDEEDEVGDGDEEAQ